jgi:hypothetical protein
MAMLKTNDFMDSDRLISMRMTAAAMHDMNSQLENFE